MKTKKTTTKKSTKTAGAIKRDPDVVPLTEAMAKPAKVSAGKKNGNAKAAGEKKLSCLSAAAVVLKASGKPMNCKAMVETMIAKNLWTTKAPTPAATLYSAILRELQTKKGEARFKKVDRGQFALKD